MYLVTAAEMRELDRLTIEKYGTPGHVLMERAGVGAAELLLREFPHVHKALVLVLAGKGNNGGDGFVIARYLRQHGIRCEVVLTAKKAEVKGDALRNLRAFSRLRGRVTEVTEPAQLRIVQDKLSRCGLIVDALLGTGLNSAVRGLLATLIDLVNASPCPVLAVDIPSGLDSDYGVPLGTAVQAQVTTTFAFPKVGQLIYPGAEYVGQLVIVDIGIAAQALTDIDLQTELLLAEEIGSLVHKRSADGHKGDFGHVLVIAGSRGKTGAALICCQAAMRTGAGLVTLGSPASLNSVLASAVLEVMTVPLADNDEGSLRFDNEEELSRALAGKTAVVLGPGIGVSSDTIALTRWLVTHCELPLVIDADGLNCLAQGIAAWPKVLQKRSAPVILTPHPGEMSRLTRLSTTQVQERRVEIAHDFAQTYHCYLVLKGARTVISTPSGKNFINPTGNPGMATGGMGDALTGILGSLLAQGYPPEEATTLGVFLHGYIGDKIAQKQGEIGILARDIIEGIPQGLTELQKLAEDETEE